MKTFVMCLFTLMITTAVSHAELMVISNKSITQTSISRQDIKDIFLGKKVYWNDKSKISVAALTQQEPAQAFFSIYLNQTPKQFDAHWDKKLFTGGTHALKRLKSSKLMVEYVSQTQGAIGFIDSNNPPKDVTILTVE